MVEIREIGKPKHDVILIWDILMRSWTLTIKDAKERLVKLAKKYGDKVIEIDYVRREIRFDGVRVFKFKYLYWV